MHVAVHFAMVDQHPERRAQLMRCKELRSDNDVPKP